LKESDLQSTIPRSYYRYWFSRSACRAIGVAVRCLGRNRVTSWDWTIYEEVRTLPYTRRFTLSRTSVTITATAKSATITQATANTTSTCASALASSLG
jgi:hypothetical protein